MPPAEISHYRIIRKLGAGGMGEVFLAEDRTLGRKVAIKMLSERWAAPATARQRLINEAKAAAALDHPNICSIHEVGEDGDQVFIVMQYIDGQTLAERIWKSPLPPRDVVDIGVQVAQALEAAARNGSVASTQVTIRKVRSKPTPVEVGAWDDNGRLVAFRRIAIR